MNIRKRFAQKLLATAVAVALPGTAFAQLEEVIVTATKRAQSTQDIPMSIEAVTGEMLVQQGISDMEDLSASIPNFSVGMGIATTTIVMRGMGSGNNRSFEQSVAMFIDGVYMPRSRQYVAPFTDLERVEVLRGPQAVLFGLNATAGSISVVTAKNQPGDAFEASVTGEYEAEYGGYSATAVIGGSPTDSLGLRLVYQNRGGGDGFMSNSTTGDDFGRVESDIVRLVGVWEPSDTLSISAKVEYADFEQEGSVGEIFGPNSGAVDNGDGKLDWESSSDDSNVNLLGLGDAGLSSETLNVVINADYMIGEHTLTAVLGYSDFDWSIATDLDTSPTFVNIPGFPTTIDSGIDETYEQQSLELRWTSPAGEAFEFIVGGYLQTSDNDQVNPTVYDLGPAFGLGVGGFRLQSTNVGYFEQDMWSVFGSGTWNMSDTLRIIAGVRHVDEEKDIQGVPETFIPGFDFENVDLISYGRESSNTMPELVVQWDMSEDAMLFAKVGTSAKSGGFTLRGEEFDDETVLGMELGIKSRLLDGSAELNATIFRNEFDDLQVNSFDTTGDTIVALTSNAGSSISQGIEIDGRWAVNDWLILNGSVAFLDAEYDAFGAGPCPQSAPSPTGFCDLSGEKLPYAADYTGNLGADIRTALSSSMDFTAGVNVSFSDEYFTDGALDPIGVQDSWTRVGARVGIAGSDDRWSLSLIGKNLTEEEVTNTSQPLFDRYLGYLSAPRTVLLQATYRFGG